MLFPREKIMCMHIHTCECTLFHCGCFFHESRLYACTCTHVHKHCFRQQFPGSHSALRQWWESTLTSQILSYRALCQPCTRTVLENSAFLRQMSDPRNSENGHVASQRCLKAPMEECRKMKSNTKIPTRHSQVTLLEMQGELTGYFRQPECRLWFRNVGTSEEAFQRAACFKERDNNCIENSGEVGSL